MTDAASRYTKHGQTFQKCRARHRWRRRSDSGSYQVFNNFNFYALLHSACQYQCQTVVTSGIMVNFFSRFEEFGTKIKQTHGTGNSADSA